MTPRIVFVAKLASATSGLRLYVPAAIVAAHGLRAGARMRVEMREEGLSPLSTPRAKRGVQGSAAPRREAK